MKKGSFFRRFFCLVLAVFMATLSSASVFAVQNNSVDQKRNQWLKEASQNNILFYDPSQTSCDSEVITGQQVTIIGDSLSVGAKDEFDAQLSGIDYSAKTFNGVTYELIQSSKHFANDGTDNYSGMTIARELENQGGLRTYVVFALGTNDPGGVSETMIEELVDLIGTNHKILLVTNYAYDNAVDYSSNNAAMFAAAKKYPEKIAVVDWAGEAENHPSWLSGGDSYVHPGSEGSKAFVSLIKQALSHFTANSISGIGGNRNYAGVEVWSAAELQAIEVNYAIYEEAANKYDFPWQILAVLHSHETGLRRYNPDNGQGVYQLYSYTSGGTNANRFEPASEISEDEFRRQTMIAAEIVSEMMKGRDLYELDNVKRLFFQYNGISQVYIDKAIEMGFSEEEARNGEGSAYVMNRYDERRDPTSLRMSSLWSGRYVADGKYDETATSNGFGAFVQYEALSGGSYCSWGGGTITETAIYLSWEGESSHRIDDPKPEYVNAMKETGAWILPCGENGECPYYGASCDQFVATVMRYSGADPNFPIFHGSYYSSKENDAGQNYYMDDHPEMYQKIENVGNSSNLQPGDIFVVNNKAGGYHILIYIGEIDGQDSQASASWGGRTGEHYAGIPFREYGLEYSIYRRINY